MGNTYKIELNTDIKSGHSLVLNPQFSITYKKKNHITQGIHEFVDFIYHTIQSQPEALFQIDQLPIEMIELIEWIKRILRVNISIKEIKYNKTIIQMQTVSNYFQLKKNLNKEDRILYLMLGNLEIFDFSNDAFLIVDKNLNPIYANQKFLRMFKTTQKRFNKVEDEQTLQSTIFKNDKELFQFIKNSLLTNNTEKSHFHQDDEKTLQLKISNYKTYLYSDLYCIQMIDLTLESQLEKKYKDKKVESEINLEKSLFDELTQIGNRRLCELEFNRILKYSTRFYQPLTFILFDIDDFKKINDQLGHIAGDLVLKDFASQLKSVIRENDVLTRFGGEEFYAIIQKTTENEIQIIINKIFKKIELAKVSFEDTNIKYSVSAGVTHLDINKDNATQFFDSEKSFRLIYSELDLLLYAAKKRGKKRFEYKKLT